MRSVLSALEGVLVLAAAVLSPSCGSDDDGSVEMTSQAANGGSGGGSGTASADGCSMSSGGTAITNLCGAATLGSLSAAQAAQLCSDAGDYVLRNINKATGCKYLGIIAAASSSAPSEMQLQSSCSGTEQSCTRDPMSKGPGGGTLCGQIPPTCSATVEQFSSCLKDQALLFDQGAAALESCSALTFAKLSLAFDVATAAGAAPSCMALQSACPGYSVPYIQ
jgi:hypothetical protein